jgi:hypothetical protein
MPSGFQQDSNQLAPNFYRVVWVANTGTYPTADGNTNGAVTPNSADSFATQPSTLIKGKARARGNMRFRNIVNRLTGLADCQIVDIETGIGGGGPEINGDSVITSLAFSARYDRDAGLVAATTALNKSTTAVDGSTAITTNAIAVKDQVVRGFIDATTASMRVYNGDSSEGQQLSITVAAPDTASNIWADVTVTQIDGTELITYDESGPAE